MNDSACNELLQVYDGLKSFYYGLYGLVPIPMLFGN